MLEDGAGGGARLRKRDMIAVMIGGTVEFYDFVVFSFFAIQIGRAYFPAESAFASLMLSLGTFALGFAARPLGGLVLGAYADRVGRRQAMTLTLVLMGTAIVAIALIPPYAAIGMAAPLLAVAARLVQGFALGGEVAPAVSLLVEGGSAERRGTCVAVFATYTNIGPMVGSAVGLLLSLVLSEATLDAEGWRIAFLLGALTLPIGVWLRRNLPETLERAPADERSQGALAVMIEHRRALALGLLMICAGSTVFYLLQYTATFAQTVLHMPPSTAFASTLVANLVGVPALIVAGWLSDVIGRRKPYFWARLVATFVAVPIFAWIADTHSTLALLGGTAVLSVLSSIGTSITWVWFAEMLPMHARGRGFGTMFGLGLALFGGTAQMVVTWLIHVTGSELAPAWYMAAMSAITAAVALITPETAPGRTLNRAAQLATA